MGEVLHRAFAAGIWPFADCRQWRKTALRRCGYLFVLCDLGMPPVRLGNGSSCNFSCVVTVAGFRNKRPIRMRRDR